MAEIAGALLSSFLEITIEKLASGQILDFFRGRKDDEELCEKLKMLLVFMDPLVAYAEQIQITNTSVRVWVNYVRYAVLDAEDLLDEIDIQITQTNLNSKFHTIKDRTRNFFSCLSSFDNKVERMKKIVDRLEFLQKQKDMLQLKNASGADAASIMETVKSTSLLSRSDNDNAIYGRDDDKRTIVNWLTSSTPTEKKVSIISIVGMGGLGKTTLAQLVYNDPIMKDKFDIQAWVGVSDDFDVLKLTKAILVAITKSTTNDQWQLEQVHGKLKEALTGKKFLLVLDDVWNEDRDKWEAVQTPLNYGAPGSKILVTTRITKVAESCMRSDKIHDLKELQEDHCWQVFVKNASNNENHKLDPEFEQIGKEIVSRCKGLPLALKAMGSLLYGKSLSNWETVLKSEIWQLPGDKIMPALLLSYYHLPSHLKRCFAFCALFPKDFNFDREELILLWMGENYVQCCDHNKSMAEVGKEYFDDLLTRSFFQRSSKDAQLYVMHDLHNDLAKYVYGDVCYTLEGVDNEKNISEKTRHFLFQRYYISDFERFKDLYKASRLRTVLPVDWEKLMAVDKYLKWSYGASICDLFSKFKFIRVLSLCNNKDLTKVPDSIGNLKYLRSLDLSATSIEKLPDSTCSLYNLLILKLKECTSLKKLPGNSHKLTKLQHLDLRGTKLRKLPMHLGQLKNLQILTGSFCVGKQEEFKIQQLGELNICGELHILEMQNIVDPSHALAANFKSKMNLVKLHLIWRENHDVSEKEKEVLENLQPSEQLKELIIENYGGTEFPCWFGDGSLSSVVSLELIDCKNCTSLPSLGQLRYLKKLSITDLNGIVAIGEEFYGSTSSSFASLETLVFKYMDEWKKWDWEDVTDAFPKLRELSIMFCPKLKGPLPEQLSCLEKLTISDCKKLGECMEVSAVEETISDVSLSYYFPNPIQHSHNSLVVLSIIDTCFSFTTFPLDFFPNLHSLCLRGCDNLQMISQEHIHNHLTKLDIVNCPQFESFPSEGLSAPRLERFSIVVLKNLKSLPKQMDKLLPSLIELSIENCPEVESISDEPLPLNLKMLFLTHCSKLLVSLKGALGANTSLQSLYISRMDMESFPDEGLLPPSLTHLFIFSCGDLKKLDYRGLCHLSSLTYLSLSHCPNIQCLPEEGLPKSISSLSIWGDCPLLKQRCQQPNGEDWGKIAHIRHLHIHGNESPQNKISKARNKVLDLVSWCPAALWKGT